MNLSRIRSRIEALEAGGPAEGVLVVQRYEDDQDDWFDRELKKLEGAFSSTGPALTVVLTMLSDRPKGEPLGLRGPSEQVPGRQ